MTTAEDIVREFVADIQAAYGPNGQDPEEVQASLEIEWPDLAVTYKKARTFVESLTYNG